MACCPLGPYWTWDHWRAGTGRSAVGLARQGHAVSVKQNSDWCPNPVKERRKCALRWVMKAPSRRDHRRGRKERFVVPFRVATDPLEQRQAVRQGSHLFQRLQIFAPLMAVERIDTNLLWTRVMVVGGIDGTGWADRIHQAH